MSAQVKLVILYYYILGILLETIFTFHNHKIIIKLCDNIVSRRIKRDTEKSGANLTIANKVTIDENCGLAEIFLALRCYL